jgi:hypothetical protein
LTLELPPKSATNGVATAETNVVNALKTAINPPVMSFNPAFKRAPNPLFFFFY